MRSVLGGRAFARKRVGFAAALLLVSFLLPLPAFAAVKIEEVTSAGGIKAWLVRDDKLPLIALHFAFRGGVEQDPADKQGLAELTAALLTEAWATPMPRCSSAVSRTNPFS